MVKPHRLPKMRIRDGIFSFDGDTAKQAAFDREVDRLVGGTNFVAFGAGIRKDAFQEDFVATKINPYLPTDVYAVAIQMVLERYVDYLAVATREKPRGRLTFEAQGPREDAEHLMHYAMTLLGGTQWVPESAFQAKLETRVEFVPKH